MRKRSMLRTAATAALSGFVLVTAGCFHTILNTDLAPSPVVHKETFKPAFIFGLVPANVDATKVCQGKRWARVETQYSFLDWVVGFVTAGIFTPMDAEITCAES